MANAVRISKPHLETLLDAIEQFEKYTTNTIIASAPSTQAFQVYLDTRRPMLQSLYIIKYALQFQINPEVVEV